MINEEEKGEEENRVLQDQDQTLEDYVNDRSEQPIAKRWHASRRQLLPSRDDVVDRKISANSMKNDKEPDWQYEEQKQFRKGILNPIFQAEQYVP